MGESKEIKDRGNWSGKFDFFLSCVGYAVGLGNVWRFPYLCYRNGGGAFLVPYAIMLFVAGIPLFFFELSLGQFSSQGPVTVWGLCPLFAGIGWGMILISAMVAVYYNVIIMYSVYYMLVSLVNLDSELPWQSCGKPWNTNLCRDQPYPDFDSMNETMKVNRSLELKQTSCLNKILGNLSEKFDTVYTDIGMLNSTILLKHTKDCDTKFVTPADEYWNNYVLQVDQSTGLDDLAGLSVRNAILLFATWCFIFFCLMKGIKSSGKVVYFTATFPYVVLIILLVRGLTLPGMQAGIDFYIIPQWDLLKNPKVWGDAATQIFYSLGPAFGGLLTMSSYNNFNNNCLRDAFLVALINCGTSVFAGFAIFSLLGYMSYMTNVPVSEVAASGPGLAFIAYPEGLAKLPSPPIWAFLFFFMLFTLGLDSQFAMMETVISGITDVFPRLRNRKALFTFFCCMVGFLLGLPQVTRGGIYVLTLTDWYSGSYNLMLIGLLELVVVAWVYGVNNFKRDVEMMLGKVFVGIWGYFFATWCVITPVSIAFIIVMMGIHYTPASLNDYTYPPFAEVLGWMMVLAPVICVIVGVIVQTCRYGGVRNAMKPIPTWGPARDEDRKYPYSPLTTDTEAPAGNGVPEKQGGYVISTGKTGNLNPGYQGYNEHL